MSKIMWNAACFWRDSVDNTRFGIALNDLGAILLVFPIDGQINYCLGTLNDDGTIAWNDSDHLDHQALTVHVSVNNKGQVLVVWDGPSDGHYITGQIDGSKIDWNDAHKYASDVSCPTVSFNDLGQAVSVYVHDGDIRYQAGQFNGTDMDWGSDHRYGKGKHNPSVALDGEGNVISLFQDGDIDPTLYYQHGVLGSDKTIDWSDRHHLTNGHGTSVALDANKVAEVHISPDLQTNWYHYGSVSGSTVDWGGGHEIPDVVGQSLEVAIRQDGWVVMAFLRGTAISSFQLWTVSGKVDT